MEAILNQKVQPEKAARQWLSENPQQVEAWLKDVKTREGKVASTAVLDYLKQS